MAGKTRVEGLDRLKRKINALPKVTRDEFRKALDKSGTEWERLAKTLSPVDDGDLRDSHRHEQGDHELQEKLLTGDEKVWYAHFLEFGTIKMPAKPSHIPAYRLLKNRIKGRTKRATKKAARAAARGER